MINVTFSYKTNCFIVEAPINEIICRRLWASTQQEMINIIDEAVREQRILPLTMDEKMQVWDDMCYVAPMSTPVQPTLFGLSDLDELL